MKHKKTALSSFNPHISYYPYKLKYMRCSSIQFILTCSCPVWWLCLHAVQNIPFWWGWCNFLLWGTHFVSLLCPFCQMSCGNKKQMMTLWNIERFLISSLKCRHVRLSVEPLQLRHTSSHVWCQWRSSVKLSVNDVQHSG